MALLYPYVTSYSGKYIRQVAITVENNLIFPSCR